MAFRALVAPAALKDASDTYFHVVEGVELLVSEAVVAARPLCHVVALVLHAFAEVVHARWQVVCFVGQVFAHFGELKRTWTITDSNLPYH